MEKTRILVVDDDESVLEYLASSLGIMGYEVSTAGTATEAIGRLRTAEAPFPLVVTDIMMPGIDGIELLKTIRKNFPDAMVIMITAHSSEETAIRALNEGAFAYLRKPINQDELASTLKNAYRTYSLARDNAHLVDELKKAKEYNEAIIENLIYLIVATDTGGVIKKINKAFVTLLGYNEDELINAPLATIFGKDFQYNAWNNMIRENRVTDFPVTFLTKGGREITVHFTGTIMKDADGKVLGFLGTAKA